MGVKGLMVMSSMCLPSNRSQLGTNQNVQFLLAFLGVHLWAALYTYYVKVKKKKPSAEWIPIYCFPIQQVTVVEKGILKYYIEIMQYSLPVFVLHLHSLSPTHLMQHRTTKQILHHLQPTSLSMLEQILFKKMVMQKLNFIPVCWNCVCYISLTFH